MNAVRKFEPWENEGEHFEPANDDCPSCGEATDKDICDYCGTLRKPIRISP